MLHASGDFSWPHSPNHEFIKKDKNKKTCLKILDFCIHQFGELGREITSVFLAEKHSLLIKFQNCSAKKTG